jgi:hypothetical protein
MWRDGSARTQTTGNDERVKGRMMKRGEVYQNKQTGAVVAVFAVKKYAQSRKIRGNHGEREVFYCRPEDVSKPRVKVEACDEWDFEDNFQEVK